MLGGPLVGDEAVGEISGERVGGGKEKKSISALLGLHFG